MAGSRLRSARFTAMCPWRIGKSSPQPLGITGGVLVQAAPTVAETLHLLALAEENPVGFGCGGLG